MKTGDRTQAAVLSVVAVLAVAFLAFQLVPKAKKTLEASPRAIPTSASVTAESDNLPLTVIGNPFSHPKLAVEAPLVEPTPKKHGPVPSEIDKSGGMPLNPGRLPPGEAVSTEENAGTGQQEEEKGPRVTLTGLMRVDQPLAMLAVENNPPRAFAAGEMIAKETRLIAIGDGKVTIGFKGKERELAVGDTMGAKKEQTQ